MSLPTFTLNNTKLDGGSVRFTIGSKKIQGITSLNYDLNHESGDVYGTGGQITGYTRGIFRGGSGTITMYYEDYTDYFNSVATHIVEFFRRTDDLIMTYQDVATSISSLTINNVKWTAIGQTFETDSSDALLINLSFKFTGIQDKGLLGAVGSQVVNQIRQFI